MNNQPDLPPDWGKVPKIKQVFRAPCQDDKLPENLAVIKTRIVHGVFWRYDLVDLQTKKILKRSQLLQKLEQWASKNGFTISTNTTNP